VFNTNFSVTPVLLIDAAPDSNYFIKLFLVFEKSFGGGEFSSNLFCPIL
jgi:hypothetical protein